MALPILLPDTPPLLINGFFRESRPAFGFIPMRWIVWSNRFILNLVALENQEFEKKMEERCREYGLKTSILKAAAARK
jgi:hypothetical protein